MSPMPYRGRVKKQVRQAARSETGQSGQLGSDKPIARQADERSADRLAGLALAVMTAVGAWLRLLDLGSIPPGLHYDEAFYGLDALHVLADGVRPIFFEANNGREPLFIYVLAAVFRMVGVSSLTMRSVAAIVGILAIPVVYLLVREALGSARSARMAALASALALTTLSWHLHYSRVALRATTLPIFEAVVFLLFWRAVRTRRRRDFAWTGLMLGVSMYTYLAARLLPVLLVAFVVLLVWERPAFLRESWRDLLLLAVLALVVSLPLWLYFIGHPAAFAGRLQQITLAGTAARGDTPQDLAGNLPKILGMFTSAGDWGWPSNIPGRPVLDAAGIAGFFLGLLAVIRTFRNPRYLQWPIALVVMLIPTALTNYAPNFTRGIGAVVPIVVLVGLGYAQVWEWLSGLRIADWRLRIFGPASRQNHYSARSNRLAAAALLLFLGVFSGWTAYRDYFLIWARQPQVKATFDEELRLAAAAITALPDGSEAYVSFAEPEAYQATLDFFVQRERFARPPEVPRTYRLRWHNRECLMLPPRTVHLTRYLLPPTGRTYLSALQAAFPAGQIVPPVDGLGGQPLMTIFEAPAGVTPSELTVPHRIGPLALQDAAGGRLALIGWDLPPGDAKPGDVLDLTLYWRVEQPVSRSYTIFGQLLGDTPNPQGNPVWGQRDAMPCQESLPTTAWEQANLVVTRHPVPASPEAPAGVYRLVVGMYDAATGQRLIMTDPAGQAIPDNMAILTQVMVRP